MIAFVLAALLQGAPQAEPHELYRAQMAAARAAIRLDELAEARAWLEETDPTLRGFEWRVSDAWLDQSLASFQIEGSHPACVAASPDGTTLALGRSDGAIELCRTTGGAPLVEFGRHAAGVTALSFDAAGERLISASFDGKVRIWNVAQKSLLAEFAGHANPVGGAAFSPDGELAASCSYVRDAERGVVGVAHLWSAADGALLGTLEGGRKPLVGLAFSPDGERLAAGSWNFCVFVWDVAGGAPLECAMPEEGLYNAVDAVAWSAEGEHVIGASRDHTARVWDAGSGKLVASLRGHGDAVSGLALSPDGSSLATAGADGVLKLWRTSDWTLAATLRGHADDVAACAFAPDGSRLHSASRDGTVRTWSTSAATYTATGWESAGTPYIARFSPDDARVAVGSYDGRIELRDACTLATVRSWQAHPANKSCHALAWTSDGRKLVSGSWEPIARVWDAESGTELAALEQGEGTSYLAASPDGRLAATCSGKRVVVWDLASFEQVAEFAGHSSTVQSVAFSPDSAQCASAGRDGKALVWEARSAALDFAIACEGEVAEVLFTPDGRELAVAGRGGSIDLHSAADGALIRPLARLRHAIDHIDVAPDGSRLAVASHVVALVDLRHGGVVGELRAHRDSPYNVDFDARGLRLVSCSTDRSIAVHETRPLRERSAGR